jgi:hypothetical protein
MPELLRFKNDAGEEILVEVATAPGPATRGVRPVEAIVDAGESLDRLLSRLGPAVSGIVGDIRSRADCPDEVEVEFGVRLSADSNVIIARAGGEANFRITLRWSRDRRPDG